METLIDGTKLTLWAERDRINLALVDKDDETIAEWWDADAVALVEDGFLQHLEDHKGLVAYCKTVGIIHSVTNVYSIDAWYDGNGWYENDKQSLGVYPNVPSEPRQLFAWMRRKGILSDYSKGRVHYDQTMGWICDRRGKPLIGVEDYA